MAGSRLENLNLLFIYMKFHLILHYSSVENRLLKNTLRSSIVSALLLVILFIFYCYNYVESAFALLELLGHQNSSKLLSVKGYLLIFCMKSIYIIFFVWVIAFSFKSRKLIERIVRSLEIAEEVLGIQLDRCKKINTTMYRFIFFKLAFFLACTPTLFFDSSIYQKLSNLNQVLVHAIEDAVEHFFAALGAEIFARLVMFQVKINKDFITVFSNFKILILGFCSSFERPNQAG